MEQFNSLLTSYSKLRKRTYRLGISETQEIGSRAAVRQIDKERLNIIQSQFNRIGTYSHLAPQLATAFKTAKPFEQKTDSDLVWISKDGTKFSFRGDRPDASSSLPIEFLDDIILFLEKGGDILTDPKDFVEGEGRIGMNVNTIESARLAREMENAISDLVFMDSSPIPNISAGDLNSTTASLQIYNRDNPLYTPISQYQFLLHAIIDSEQFSEEEIQEAVIENQRDAIDLLNFIKDNQEDLDRALLTGQCIQPSPQISKLRERFFISQLKPGNKRCLSYGNFQGDSTSPPKMSGIMARMRETAGSSEATQESWIKSKTGKEKSGRIASEKLAGDPSNAVAISAQVSNSKASQSSSYLFQLVDKYKNVGICVEEGDPPMSLFNVDSPQIATQLTSTISEKTSVLVDMHRRIRVAERRGATPNQVGKLKRRYAEAVRELQDAAERDCEQLKDLVNVSRKSLNVLGSYPPGTPTGVAELVNVFDTLGTDEDVCGAGEDFKNTLLEMMARELNSPMQRALEETEFAGNVEITDIHPDGRTVNQITGRRKPFEGIHPVNYTTRAVADNLLIFDNKDDVEMFMDKYKINKNSQSSLVVLNNPVNGKFIIPISDKFYTESGFTSQGKMEKLGALQDVEFVNLSIDNTFGSNHPSIEEFRDSIHQEREAYLLNYTLASLQLSDENLLPDTGATTAEIDLVKNKDRASLDEFLKNEILSLPPNNKDRIELEDLQVEIENFDKSSSADPASKDSIAQRNNLSHKIADVKRKSQRRNMTSAKSRKSEAAGEHLNRLATTGSSGAILNAKYWSSAEASNISEDDIRMLNGILFQETWSGNKTYTSDIKECVKGGTRRTNRKSGAIEVSITGGVHTTKASKLVEEINSAQG